MSNYVVLDPHQVLTEQKANEATPCQNLFTKACLDNPEVFTSWNMIVNKTSTKYLEEVQAIHFYFSSVRQ